MGAGMVDVYALTMSLRSRISTEVAFALNALTLIGSQLRPTARDPGIILSLEKCDDLLDEVLDLLEETAFDLEGDGSEELLLVNPPPAPRASGGAGRAGAGAVIKGPPTLRQMVVQALDEEAHLKSDRKRKRSMVRQVDDLRPDLGQTEVLLSLLNIVRGFAGSDDSMLVIASDPRVLAILISLCGLSATSARKLRPDLALSTMDRLRIRRDVVSTLSVLGSQLDLTGQPLSVCQAILELCAFYFEDGCEIPRSTVPLDLATPAGQQAYNAQQRARRAAMDQQHDSALVLLANVAVLDKNREALGRCDATLMSSLISMLLQMLPLESHEYADLRDEEGLTRLEMEAMSLFNLTFMSPRSTKVRLLQSPILTGSMVRMIRYLIAVNPDYKDNPYSVLIERALATIRICYEAAQNDGAAVSSGDSVGRQWFGGGFAHDDEPSSGDAPGGPPSSLATRRKAVFDILAFKGISSGVYNQLCALLDGK